MYRPNLPPLRLALQLDNAGKRESHFSSRSCDSSSSSSRSTRPPHDLSIYSLSSSSPVASASFVNIHQSCYVDSYSQTSDCSSRWRNQTSIRNNAFESFKRPCHYEELNRICPIHNGGTSINSLQNSRSYDLRPSKTQHSSPADSEIILGNRPIDDQSKSFSLGEQSNGLREAGFAMEAPLRQTGPSSAATENIYRGDNQRRYPRYQPSNEATASIPHSASQVRCGRHSTSDQVLPHIHGQDIKSSSVLRSSMSGGVTCRPNITEAVGKPTNQPVETESGPRYFCYVMGCGKSFTRNFNLTQHISAIHKEEKHFVCTFCSAAFYRRNDLSRHERAHTGDRPYKCDCGQTFTRTDLLHRHKQSGNCPKKNK